MKKRLFLYLALLAFLTFTAYEATIYFMPNIIFKGFYKKVTTERGIGYNECFAIDLPDENMRAVVMPNPDFLYVGCFYDLSDGPLELTGDMPDSTYWSVSFYEPSTKNWFIQSDLEFQSNQLELGIVEEGSIKNDNSSTNLAKAPSQKGLILIRILVTDTTPKTLEKYKSWQNSIKVSRM